MNKSTSATEWKHMYFFGITKQNQNEIDLSQENIGALLSMVNVYSGISTGAAIDPKFLINAKGTTVWLAMYAFLTVSNPEALSEAKKEDALLYLPSDFLNNTFNAHNNWPPELLSAFDLNLKNYNLFAIPFLVPRSERAIKNLPQSLKAPDGSLEVFGVQEFDEAAPEKLLAEFDSIIKFIIKERSDIVVG